VSSSDGDGEDGRTAWTLGAIKERNLALEGYCQTRGCGHFYVFNVDNLISGMGADYVVPEILPGAVCKACGGLEVQAGAQLARGLTPLLRGERQSVPTAQA